MARAWRTGHLIAAGVAGVALGAIGGWTLAAPTGAPPLVTVAVNPRRPPILPSHPAARAPVPSPALAVPPAAINPEPATPREAELEARVKDLERELAAERSEAQDAAGSPLTAPANLGDKFGQAGLMAAVNEAAKRLDPAPQITTVDCTECPCIVYGTGMTAADAKLFQDAAGVKSYSTNGTSHFSSTSDGDFAFTALPADDPNPADNRDKRLTTRINQMFVETRNR